jgi:ketosteroid isomerase-like protein
MSQENVEIVRRAVVASTSKPTDLATVNALYHRDHVLMSDWGVEGRAYRGASGWAESIADLDAAWQDWRQEIERVIDAGDAGVVVLVRLKARGRGSDVPIDRPWAMVIGLRDGRLISTRTFLDRDAALKAVGLDE